MARVNNTNYGGTAATDFDYATDDNDPFDRDDVSKVAQAVDTHDHSPGKGLAVARVADASIVEAKLGAGAVTTDKIADGAVTSDKIGTNAVGADEIAPGAIGASEIVDGGVGTAELANSAVTTDKLNDDAVTQPKIGPGAVGTTELADDAVTVAKLGLGAVDTNALADNSVTLAKMTDSSVDTTELVDLAVETGKIADDAVTQAKIGPAAVGTTELADAGVTEAKLAANAVTTAKITDANVTLAKLDRVAGAPSDGQVLSYSNADSKLKFVTPGSFSFPSGLGGYVSTAAEIPSGWARDSNLDGRMPVGAGTLFSVTHNENTNYGSAWSFTPAGSVTIVIATHTAAELNGNIDIGGSDEIEGSHNHGISSQTFTGNSQSWDMPRRGVVWVKKS